MEAIANGTLLTLNSCERRIFQKARAVTMHNWRLLLLAFLAVLHPIASFTERKLVDGREQCCDRNSLLRDSRLSYGSDFNKLSKNHRLSRVEFREERRYGVRRENPLFAGPSADRRLIEFRSDKEESRFSPETVARFVRADIRRVSVADNRDERERRIRDIRRTSSRNINRDLRKQDVSRVQSRASDVRQHNRDALGPSHTRESRNDKRFSRNTYGERRFRMSMESRRETRYNSEERRVQERREAREVLQRARNDVVRRELSRDRQDRRVLGERMKEQRARSESNKNNRERRSPDHRVREDVEERRSRSVNRMLEDSRLDERQRVNARREIFERFDQRQVVGERNELHAPRDRITFVRRESRDRTLDERRVTRDSTDTTRNVENRNVRLDQAGTRRDSRVQDRRVPVNSRDERDASESHRFESRRLIHRQSRHHDDVVERRSTDRGKRDTQDEIRMNRSSDALKRDMLRSKTVYRDAKNMERNARFRTNVEFIRSRDTYDFVREKIQTGHPTFTVNWQYIFYTLQGIYLCSVLMQMISYKESAKKPRCLSWLSAPRNLIKMD